MERSIADQTALSIIKNNLRISQITFCGKVNKNLKYFNVFDGLYLLAKLIFFSHLFKCVLIKTRNDSGKIPRQPENPWSGNQSIVAG